MNIVENIEIMLQLFYYIIDVSCLSTTIKKIKTPAKTLSIGCISCLYKSLSNLLFSSLAKRVYSPYISQNTFKKCKFF